MGTGLGKGWDRESEDMFIHDSGARISRSMYRGKMAWWYFPVSLDTSAVEHAPTDEGREDAFATSAKELSTWKPKPKPKAKTAPVKKETAVSKGEEGEPKGARPDPSANPDEEDADEAEEDAEDAVD